ncbi:MAG: M23 family metallopeptidase [Eubacteriales bacterium]|jgi:murein DD-endopeptidase MepM/ murein hydrolase activator NlpD
MPEKNRCADNDYLYGFITVLVILITTVYCISVVSAHNPPGAGAQETTALSAESTQIPTSETSGTETGSALPVVQERPAIVFPLDGKITSVYAYRIDPFYDPASGEEPTYEFHHGIDISAARSRDILACADGEVVFTGYDSSYGYYLLIDHGSFVSLYAHCQSFGCSVGDRVQAGDFIATAGNTGRSTGPHLHFEIRVDDNPVDPLLYVGCVYAGTMY